MSNYREDEDIDFYTEGEGVGANEWRNEGDDDYCPPSDYDVEDLR